MEAIGTAERIPGSPHQVQIEFVVGQVNGSKHTQDVRAGTLKTVQKFTVGQVNGSKRTQEIRAGTLGKRKISPNCIARGS